jgi:hypothetical protein
VLSEQGLADIVAYLLTDASAGNDAR